MIVTLPEFFNNPSILEIGSFRIQYYALTWILSAVFIYLYLKKHPIKESMQMTDDSLNDLIFMYGLFFGAMLGGRVGYMLFYGLDQLLSNPLSLFFVWEGGLSFHGGLIGVGAGKSIMKNHLPQSNSDFIFAIIVEEFGIIGGSVIILLYVLMFFRILIITHKADDKFGKILVSGLGILILVQAFTNISVATQIIPVTGQNLPLISSGGSSAWMTCISLGMILSVSSSIKKKKIGF